MYGPITGQGQGYPAPLNFFKYSDFLSFLLRQNLHFHAVLEHQCIGHYVTELETLFLKSFENKTT
jgi:hypothetical protein